MTSVEPSRESLAVEEAEDGFAEEASTTGSRPICVVKNALKWAGKEDKERPGDDEEGFNRRPAVSAGKGPSPSVEFAIASAVDRRAQEVEAADEAEEKPPADEAAEREERRRRIAESWARKG